MANELLTVTIPTHVAGRAVTLTATRVLTDDALDDLCRYEMTAAYWAEEYELQATGHEVVDDYLADHVISDELHTAIVSALVAEIEAAVELARENASSTLDWERTKDAHRPGRV